MGKPKSLPGSMNDWARAFRTSDDLHIANLFSEDEKAKHEGLRKLEELSLPHLKKVKTDLLKFLINPDYYFDQIPSKKYYINLISTEKEERIRAIDLTRPETVDFIKSRLDKAIRKHFTIIVFEYYENLYGGNIVISPKGSVLLELAQGTHLTFTIGETTPHWFAELHDPEHGIIFYQKNQGKIHPLDNVDIKQSFEHIFQLIPKTQKYLNNSERYYPGYYEFVLVRKTRKSRLTPIFIDYRDAEHYQI